MYYGNIMRIPFIPKVDHISELRLEPDLLRFVRESKAGSSLLLAGASFWFLISLVSLITPEAQVTFILYGGLAVPLLGILFARLQGARLFANIRYASLAAFAVLPELAALPIMFFLRESNPEALPGILMITDGAHLVIYMWLYLDYYYFLAATAKVVLGILFLFGMLFVDSYTLQTLTSGVISLITALLVWKDSGRTESLYVK